MIRTLLRAQGVFYIATGLWPIVSLRSFEAVTGPKAEGWLVKTTGGLIAAVGATLVAASRARAVPREATLLGASSAAVLGTCSLWYPLRGRISKIYLADAAVEAGIVAAHLAALGSSAPGSGRERESEVASEDVQVAGASPS